MQHQLVKWDSDITPSKDKTPLTYEKIDKTPHILFLKLSYTVTPDKNRLTQGSQHSRNI